MVKKTKQTKSDCVLKFEEFEAAFIDRLNLLSNHIAKIDADLFRLDYELALNEEDWETICNLFVTVIDDYSPFGNSDYGVTYMLKPGNVTNDAELLADCLFWEVAKGYYNEATLDNLINEGLL
jgi:hypothetical protein